MDLLSPKKLEEEKCNFYQISGTNRYHLTLLLRKILYPLVIKNFIDKQDVLLFKNLINSNIIFNNPLLNDIDNRLFEWNPEYKDAVYFVKKYAKKILKNKNLYVHVALFVKYLPGSFIPVHSDIMSEKCVDDKLSLVLYFNEEYEGGEIYFPYLNKEYKPNSGSAIYYPPQSKEFEHGVNPIIKGEKYIIAFCFTSNKKYATKHYL